MIDTDLRSPRNMGETVYACRMCKRTLNPDGEDVHLVPVENSQEHEAYCSHCWSAWNMFAAKYGLDVLKEEVEG